MSAIEIRNLAKRYRIGGQQQSYHTLREVIGSWRQPRMSEKKVDFWALSDVSFDVAQGEAIGILGRNGAGKSTLLKILSRITEPTSGLARMHGRVASLLEVGTGFHPELTGRENILLNGTILGMTRREINSHFDEIVAFAEIEQFLETPVKFYSSGMYVRLAFAVAAYLTPEILIVDEVLAVGDAEFQRRCLGRMNTVAKSGRTVIFVSHNMAAIEELCSRSVLLHKGRVQLVAPTRDVVATYLAAPSGRASWDVEALTDREGNGRARIVRIEILRAEEDKLLDTVPFRSSFRLRLHYRAHDRVRDPRIGIALLNEKGERVTMSETAEAGTFVTDIHGVGYIDCAISAPNLLPHSYRLEVWIIDVPNVSFADHLHMIGRLDITAAADTQNVSALSFHNRGHVLLDCKWSLTEAAAR